MPTLPLTYGDAAALFALAREHAAPPLVLDVMHDRKDLIIKVYDGKVQVYEKRLRAR